MVAAWPPSTAFVTPIKTVDGGSPPAITSVGFGPSVTINSGWYYSNDDWLPPPPAVIV